LVRSSSQIQRSNLGETFGVDALHAMIIRVGDIGVEPRSKRFTPVDVSIVSSCGSTTPGGLSRIDRVFWATQVESLGRGGTLHMQVSPLAVAVAGTVARPNQGHEQCATARILLVVSAGAFVVVARWLASLASVAVTVFAPAHVQNLRNSVAVKATSVGCAPKALLEALECAEDRRFRLHAGIDPLAVVRAAWRTATSGRREGGSTIEQQLVRTLTGRRERTLRRKLLEMGLAAVICRWFTKDMLASIYLHVAYFGWRMNGLEQALRGFGVARGCDIDLQAACVIVARLKLPQPARPSSAWWHRVRVREGHIARLLSIRSPHEHCLLPTSLVENVDIRLSRGGGIDRRRPADGTERL
jgi:hypothetical protein